jgi:hypothetical protein
MTGTQVPTSLSGEGGLPIPTLRGGFTEIQLSKIYLYLLVVACTFTGWAEAFPTHTEKAPEVSRVLAKGVIPQFGVPSSSGSDNGPAFISQVVKGISCAFRLTWDLHTWCHPQSAG